MAVLTVQYTKHEQQSDPFCTAAQYREGGTEIPV